MKERLKAVREESRCGKYNPTSLKSRRPEVPDRPTRFHRDGQTRAAEVTPTCHAVAVNPYPGNRQAHRPRREADCCQLGACLAQRIPLSQTRGGTRWNFSNGFEAKRSPSRVRQRPQPK